MVSRILAFVGITVVFIPVIRGQRQDVPCTNFPFDSCPSGHTCTRGICEGSPCQTHPDCPSHLGCGRTGRCEREPKYCSNSPSTCDPGYWCYEPTGDCARDWFEINDCRINRCNPPLRCDRVTGLCYREETLRCLPFRPFCPLGYFCYRGDCQRFQRGPRQEST